MYGNIHISNLSSVICGLKYREFFDLMFLVQISFYFHFESFPGIFHWNHIAWVLFWKRSTIDTYTFVKMELCFMYVKPYVSLAKCLSLDVATTLHTFPLVFHTKLLVYNFGIGINTHWAR